MRPLAMMVVSTVVVARLAAAEPSELERLRAENAQLKARIAELEGDKARLERESTGPLAAALERSAAESVQVAFDRGSGVTTTETAPSPLVRPDGVGLRQWLRLRADRAGGQPSSTPARVQLLIDTAATQGVYRDAKALRLSVDGTTQDLAVEGYRSEPISAARSTARMAERETVVVSVPLETIARMADASEVRGSLGSVAFRLTPEQLATVRAFHRRVTS